MSNMLQTDSAVKAKVITPSDSTDLADGPTRALLIGTAGNLKVTMRNDLDANALILPVVAGYNPISVRRVWSASQSAVTVIGLW